MVGAVAEDPSEEEVVVLATEVAVEDLEVAEEVVDLTVSIQVEVEEEEEEEEEAAAVEEDGRF